MVLKLYKIDYSPPARAVLLTAAALGLDLEQIIVNLQDFENLDPKYVAMNPQHSVPVLDDDGFIVWDSHAINVYLVTKYGRDDALYPKDLYKRALIDQRMHFDSCNLFGLLRVVVRPILHKGIKTISEYLIEEMHESYSILNDFLNNQTWAAGADLTLADFSLASTITTTDVLIPIDLDKYSNIAKWLKRIQELPYYHINQKGVDDCKKYKDELFAKKE